MITLYKRKNNGSRENEMMTIKPKTSCVEGMVEQNRFVAKCTKQRRSRFFSASPSTRANVVLFIAITNEAHNQNKINKRPENQAEPIPQQVISIICKPNGNNKKVLLLIQN